MKMVVVVIVVIAATIAATIAAAVVAATLTLACGDGGAAPVDVGAAVEVEAFVVAATVAISAAVVGLTEVACAWCDSDDSGS